MTRKSPEKSNFTFSGALSREMYLLDGEEEAIEYYESIRNMNNSEYDTFVSTIACNSNFTYDDINKMIEHICFNEYLLGDGRYERLDEDIYIMYALKRLYNNTFFDCDIVLIEHEIMEHDLVHNSGYSVTDAHTETIKYHDYAQALSAAQENNLNLFSE